MINYESKSTMIKVMNQYINNCEYLTQNRNNTKMRNLEILLSYISKAINPVQYWSESHNYIEN